MRANWQRAARQSDPRPQASRRSSADIRGAAHPCRQRLPVVSRPSTMSGGAADWPGHQPEDAPGLLPARKWASRRKRRWRMWRLLCCIKQRLWSSEWDAVVHVVEAAAAGGMSRIRRGAGHRLEEHRGRWSGGGLWRVERRGIVAAGCRIRATAHNNAMRRHRPGPYHGHPAVKARAMMSTVLFSAGAAPVHH